MSPTKEKPDPASRQAAIAEVAKLLGQRLSTADGDRNKHAKDACHHAPQAPDAVAFPETNNEVAEVVRICARYRCPIVPFGTGTGVEGGVVAVQGGVSLDTSRMNKVLRIGAEDMDATVQAGVTRLQLNRHLKTAATDLFFPVDPGADASLGGMAATCASGSSAVRYGTMRENVLALTAVMADGRLIQTGTRARKSSAGYDLNHLLIGSEGTLGVITEVTLKLVQVPEAISSAVCAFRDIESAVNTVIEVLTSGISMARIELLDEIQMAAVNRYSGLSYKEAPTLFFEFHGTGAAVTDQACRVGKIVSRRGGDGFQWATESGERDKLWQARHDAYYASLALRPGSVGYVTDVCVPISELAECIRLTKKDLEGTQVPAPLFGHVGDGNFHVVFAIDPDSAAELEEVRAIDRRIVGYALARDGTSTGEHGIGIGKLDALLDEHGEAAAVMGAIKKALDPDNIMNPGKVLR
jgi:D-lactate dehydrogenase (cytochrome)